MELVLGGQPNMNPPLIINQSTNFEPEDSDSPSSHLQTPVPDHGGVTPTSSKDEEIAQDPFLSGSASNRPRKRRKTDSAAQAEAFMNAFEKKWEEEKEVEAQAHKETKEHHEQLLAMMQGSQRSFDRLVDVLAGALSGRGGSTIT